MRSRHHVRLILTAWLAMASSAHGATFERGVAVTDARALRELDLREVAVAGQQSAGFGLAHMLGVANKATGADIFALPSMIPLRAALDREFDAYAASAPGTLQLFDRNALVSPRTRFSLAGIVNRMDRAYVSPETCGDIRLIYRPIVSDGGNPVRLPVTLNLVLRARNPSEQTAISCAEIARRWLASGDMTDTGADLASKLMAKGGALEFAAPDHIDRIEINIQIARASVNPEDFSARADYLMKVFKYDARSKTFIENPMENQIDRDRILSDVALAADFRQWLLAPDNLAALDRGAILIPEKFLAAYAVVVTPSTESNTQGIFADNDIVAALARAAISKGEFETVKSAAGFERRLNDSTCAGCHQTRAIGGFHFPGVDWSANAPGFVVASGSPHFTGDQPRRRDILMAFRDGRTPDFSRGFSARPQARRADDLDGTTYLNGWGAHCYAPEGLAAKPDRSFASWRCIDGLECQMPAGGGSATRAGLCFPAN